MDEQKKELRSAQEKLVLGEEENARRENAMKAQVAQLEEVKKCEPDRALRKMQCCLRKQKNRFDQL